MSFNSQKYQEIKAFISNNLKNIKKDPIIVAVSKNQPVSSIKLALNYGIRIFGENKIQEASGKFSDLKKIFNDIELHLVGPLQTNKVKIALSLFDVLQTLDREKLAIEINKYTLKASNKKFFIQVNTGQETQKSGIYPAYAKEFINFCRHDLKLSIIGLMCMPPIDDDPIKHFVQLQQLANENNLSYLSMGMSSDYEKALYNGATHLRLGTVLFGER